MKTTVTEVAYAKVNLTMDVLEPRPDGYHDVKSVMQEVQLCDKVTLTRTDDDKLVLTSNVDTLPLDEDNTIIKAVRAFEKETGASVGGLSIHLEKNIPVEAGVGGGSSDAAAVLRGLDELYGRNKPLVEQTGMAAEVGSDVPFFLYGGTCIVEGKGDVVGRLAGLPDCWFVLCKPDFSLSTAEMYKRVDDQKLSDDRPDSLSVMLGLEWQELEFVAKRVGNVFEQVLTEEEQKAVSGIKETLLSCGAMGASMSGSGPLVYGIFEGEEEAKKAVDALKATYSQVFLTQSV
ncbi:MAG: 4-(cytidine 5'-diphospho)-2-C-methyl-D-erythritol kinase [Candidatus Onthomonas sp.]|nr:4-(cytidine 5'-diphospho)-2-C-methyl-D-erythritol kinase [Candidatus Onthomonas sp.]